MPATSTIVGASLGLGVQLYSNAVRKLPLLRSACPHAQPAGRKRPLCANPKRTARVRRRPLGARRGRGPRRHGRLIRGCLGGARATQCSRPPCLPPLHDPHLNTHAPFAAGARHQRGGGPGSQARQALRGCARLPRPAPPLLCSCFPRSATRGHCARLGGGCACHAAKVHCCAVAFARQPGLFCRAGGAVLRVCTAGAGRAGTWQLACV